MSGKGDKMSMPLSPNGPLDNVTELLQATGVAEVVVASGRRPGTSTPSRSGDRLGGAVAHLARRYQVIDL